MDGVTVLEQWRSISNPDHYELVVEMPAGTAPSIGDEIEVANVGTCEVKGAWQATKYKSPVARSWSRPSRTCRILSGRSRGPTARN